MFFCMFYLSFLSFLTYYYEYPIKPNDLVKKKRLPPCLSLNRYSNAPVLDLIPEVVAVGWNDPARSGGVELASIKIWYQMCVTSDRRQRNHTKRFALFLWNKHFG